jgi:hypothetical protein
LNYSIPAVKSAARRPPPAAPASPKLGPLPARLQHGRVELMPETVKTETGAPAQPWRSIDIVGALLRKKVITVAQANAADKFREWVQRSGLDTLKAADPARIPGGLWRDRSGPDAARRDVIETLAALGGTGRLPGSCLYHIIALEWSIKRWSMEQAGLDQECCRGILIASLCVLEAHLAGRRSAA